MEAIEVGDLISYDGYFMVVQEIDHAYRAYRGNIGSTPTGATLFAKEKNPLMWGAITMQVAQKVHRLKDTKPAEKICTCTTLELFRAGCSCGAITPYKQVY